MNPCAVLYCTIGKTGFSKFSHIAGPFLIQLCLRLSLVWLGFDWIYFPMAHFIRKEGLHHWLSQLIYKHICSRLKWGCRREERIVGSEVVREGRCGGGQRGNDLMWALLTPPQALTSCSPHPTSCLPCVIISMRESWELSPSDDVIQHVLQRS